jgi:hypothetical protein
VLKCGSVTWKFSSLEPVRLSGVPFTKSMVGACPRAALRTVSGEITLRDVRTTRNVNVAGSVSTASVAVSVSRRRVPTSSWPTTYRFAANGVTVSSAAGAQGPRCVAHTRHL